MSHLLQVSKHMSRSNTPVMVEIAVPEETAPYLVTSTDSLVWVPQPMEPTKEMWSGYVPEYVVRAAIRSIQDLPTADHLFYHVVVSVAAQGLALDWGNVHPFTTQGVIDAVRHVSTYDMGDLCLLSPMQCSLPLKKMALSDNLLIQKCSWLPSGYVVVVPKDRSFVGTLSLIGTESFFAVVHNASRAIGIAQVEDELAK